MRCVLVLDCVEHCAVCLVCTLLSDAHCHPDKFLDAVASLQAALPLTSIGIVITSTRAGNKPLSFKFYNQGKAPTNTFSWWKYLLALSHLKKLREGSLRALIVTCPGYCGRWLARLLSLSPVFPLAPRELTSTSTSSVSRQWPRTALWLIHTTARSTAGDHTWWVDDTLGYSNLPETNSTNC